MASDRSSNEALLQRLKDGTAQFELVGTPNLSSPSASTATGTGYFARIEPSLVGGAMGKVEHYTVRKVTGDARCMFRALVNGMALNKGLTLNPQQEKDDADGLGMAVRDVICGSEDELLNYKEALFAIIFEESLKRYCEHMTISYEEPSVTFTMESLKRYCRRIERSDFWGRRIRTPSIVQVMPRTDNFIHTRA